MISELPVFTIEFAIKPECLLEITHKEAWLDLYLCNIGRGLAMNARATHVDINIPGEIDFSHINYIRPGERVKLEYSSAESDNQGDVMYKIQLAVAAGKKVSLNILFDTIDNEDHVQEVYFWSGQWFTTLIT